jgi:ABC-2 type transport system ATP-binding protein
LIGRLGGDHVIEFGFAEGQPALPAASFADVPGVLSASEEAGVIRLRVGQLHLVLPAVLERVAQHGTPLAQLTTRHASLEDVFMQLTGRHLRDEGEA